MSSRNLNLTVDTFTGSPTTPHMLHPQGGNVNIPFSFEKPNPKPKSLTDDSVHRREPTVSIKRDSQSSVEDETPNPKFAASSLAPAGQQNVLKVPPNSLAAKTLTTISETSTAGTKDLHSTRSSSEISADPIDPKYYSSIATAEHKGSIELANRDSITTMQGSVAKNNQQPPSTHEQTSWTCRQVFQAMCGCLFHENRR